MMWIPRLTVAVLAATLLLSSGACRRGTDEPALPPTPRPGPSFPAGTTMDTIQLSGVLRVAISSDRPGFGALNAETGQIDGFDREIALLIAQALFGVSDLEDAFHRIVFEPFTDDEHRLIAEEAVDVVLTARPVAMEILDFAGPYLVATQDVAVRGGGSVTDMADLAGKRVCGANDPGRRRVSEPLRAAQLVVDTSAGCLRALERGEVVAVSADSSVLARRLAESPAAIKLLAGGRSEESYVIGLKKGDDAFRAFLNDLLEKLFQSGAWAAAFDRTLGTMGVHRPLPPQLDRAGGAAAVQSTSTTRR